MQSLECISNETAINRLRYWGRIHIVAGTVTSGLEGFVSRLRLAASLLQVRSLLHQRAGEAIKEYIVRTSPTIPTLLTTSKRKLFADLTSAWAAVPPASAVTRMARIEFRMPYSRL